MLTMLLTTGLLLVTDPSTTQVPSASPLTADQCNSLYSEAIGHNQNQANLSQTAVAPYMSNSSNFSKVDTNSDSKISQSEFLAGCQRGLIQQTSQTQQQQ